MNNSNDFSKRTSNQVYSILKKNNIVCSCENMGDNRTFRLNLDNSLKNRVLVKRLGFILQTTTQSDNYILIKTW